MTMIGSLRNFFEKTRAIPLEKPAAEAYDTWSASYDDQPGNLMIDLDEALFSSLLKDIDLTGKRVVDIGCGTGRHWPKIYERSPALLTGYDVSAGMLQQLNQKFPLAITRQAADNLLSDQPDASVDCIISTLTIAHIKDPGEAIASWARVLRNGGDLIITDFHPAILAKGGKRSFNDGKKTIAVVNYVHPLAELIELLEIHGFKLERKEERFIGEEVRSYYANKNVLHVYEQFKGMPVIFGLHLKKQHAAH